MWFPAIRTLLSADDILTGLPAASGQHIRVTLFCISVELTRNVMSQASEDVLLAMTQSIVPRLSHQLYKGQCGRIAVIGGCKE